jgi:hypothetical protein
VSFRGTINVMMIEINDPAEELGLLQADGHLNRWSREVPRGLFGRAYALQARTTL